MAYYWSLAMAMAMAIGMAMARYGENSVGQSVQYAPLLPASQQELVAQDFMMHHNTDVNTAPDKNTNKYTNTNPSNSSSTMHMYDPEIKIIIH